MSTIVRSRRLPVGAEVVPGGGVDVRVWAPRRRRVQVVLDGASVDLQRDDDGYFSGFVERAGAGSLYQFRLDGGDRLFPDPASRFQPEGPDGPSRVVDPAAYAWNDADWRGVPLRGQVLYELHVGTFSPEGTYDGARRLLPALRDIGITVVELMPVAEWAGRFGWGYDGVCLYAPTRNYGEPDDLRRFVDEAHRLGLGVILDVVYNHLGPRGNYLPEFSDDYFSRTAKTDWGSALNFDGPSSGPVREFFAANAGSWVEEFHMDGLRLDATQDIVDRSPVHVLAEVTASVRRAARGRSTIVCAENEPQDVRLVREQGCDALWNDDFHHACTVAITGRREAYYTDYCGSPQELISLTKWGFLYQGQRYSWQGKRRGTPSLDLPAEHRIAFLENHDQVANSMRGERRHQAGGHSRMRAFTALLLLGPATPLLFQGQEYFSSRPFLFFADHSEDPELAEQVRLGRRDFLSQFRGIATATHVLADPSDPATFEACRLDPAERERNRHAVALHRDLLRLRREDPVFRAQRADRVHGAVLGAASFLIRFLGEAGDDRLLVVNLGSEQRVEPGPEPLLAPPAGRRWDVLWSSEDVRYGGSGSVNPEHHVVRTEIEEAARYESSVSDVWILTGHAAVLLTAVPDEGA